ncbi:lipocalin family protein [Acinetobacter sp.]|jgi:apolipoprotein D and lipocalin family protein|uniref:lipocalin family protein n=1 Tax=Acinetobacter sp. TaxID=472 RepID=UPI0035AF7F00
MINEHLPKAGLSLAKIAVGGAILIGLGAVTLAYAQTKPLHAVEKVELDKYLGVWYEVARKPMSFQNKCDRDVTATYTLNENGNIQVDNRCVMKNGKAAEAQGEAFVQNAPFNSKLKVSFLPEAIRWIPAGRGDYWILKIDEHYQTVLVGEPRRNYMWVLSRTPHPDPSVINEYLEYAKSVGYDLKDIIHTKQTAQ